MKRRDDVFAQVGGGDLSAAACAPAQAVGIAEDEDRRLGLALGAAVTDEGDGVPGSLEGLLFREEIGLLERAPVRPAPRFLWRWKCWCSLG